ncbi:MAG: hypothetical protein IPM83_15475 [Ignavibacteria bacterium]|nr:hypothetical protein [Ignavibacteria bacterium]
MAPKIHNVKVAVEQIHADSVMGVKYARQCHGRKLLISSRTRRYAEEPLAPEDRAGWQEDRQTNGGR